MEGQASRAASLYWWKKKGRRGKSPEQLHGSGGKKGLRSNSLEQLHYSGGKRRSGGIILLSSFTVLVAKEGMKGQFSRAASIFLACSRAPNTHGLPAHEDDACGVQPL